MADESTREPPMISLADYEAAAERKLPAGPHGYYAGGAGDEITLRDNAASWRRLAIRPRMLTGVGQRDPSVTVLGQRRPHPLIIAPMAFQRMAHPDGEVATAQAAARTQSTMCLSTLATTGPDALAEAVPQSSRWFQLYVFTDRGVSRELVVQAAEHGYEAIVLTVDLPIMGLRERDLRSRVNADALQVASASSAGADALPAVVDAVGDQLDVLVDGGIRRGTDVLKALALGARAVMIGRPVLWGLAVSGADGAARVLEILLAELDSALALSGAGRSRDLDPSFVTAAPWVASAQ